MRCDASVDDFSMVLLKICIYYFIWWCTVVPTNSQQKIFMCEQKLVDVLRWWLLYAMIKNKWARITHSQTRTHKQMEIKAKDHEVENICGWGGCVREWGDCGWNKLYLSEIDVVTGDFPVQTQTHSPPIHACMLVCVCLCTFHPYGSSRFYCKHSHRTNWAAYLIPVMRLLVSFSSSLTILPGKNQQPRRRRLVNQIHPNEVCIERVEEQKKTPLKYTSNYIKTECHTYAHCTRLYVVVFKITTTTAAAATKLPTIRHERLTVCTVLRKPCAQFLFYSINRTSKCTHIHSYNIHNTACWIDLSEWLRALKSLFLSFPFFWCVLFTFCRW